MMTRLERLHKQMDDIEQKIYEEEDRQRDHCECKHSTLDHCSKYDWDHPELLGKCTKKGCDCKEFKKDNNYKIDGRKSKKTYDVRVKWIHEEQFLKDALKESDEDE